MKSEEMIIGSFNWFFIQNKNRALHTDTNTHKGSYATNKLLHTVVGSL